MNNCAIIIPALNPSENLIEYVKILLSKGILRIIVVNDGSNNDLAYIFNELTKLQGCTVLTHEVNQGKGRALKTAFHYFLEHHSDFAGVITADADGQHSIEDVLTIANLLATTHNGIILGARDFSQSNVPIRSYIGNRTTSFIFQLLYGQLLKDTQTGLRGIPVKELMEIANLKGERYEYEINMLIYAKKRNLEIIEIPIQTIYFDNNSASHYNSILDSFKVFEKLISGLLKYSFSTLASGIIDIASFFLLNSYILAGVPLEIRIFFATLGARALSSSLNFYMNRKLVFKSGGKLSESIIRYYLLFFGLILTSYGLVLTANLLFSFNVVLAKVCIDTLLGIASYKIQQEWVFKNNDKRKIAGEKNER